MNYEKIYNQIIERAKSREINGYTEKHHIIPKCIGGTNDKINIVELTAREHFLCHMLLVEMYPNNIKLYQALWLMSTNRNKKEHQRYKVSSRVYEKIKIKAALIYKNRKISKEEILKRSKSLKLSWYNKNLKNGLILNKQYIEKFQLIYPNFINLTNNNQNCINYCLFNNIDIHKIICPCNNGIKFFINYTQGFRNFCSIQCANKFNSTKSKLTKESNKLWDNSKKRLRKNEIMNMSKNEIEQLRRDKISNKTKGKKPYNPNTNGHKIIQYDLNMELIKEWDSIRQAGQELANTSGETIRKCLIGLQKTAYGYIWKYNK